MDDQIELHDSRVTIKQTAAGLVIRLCPAYVHHWRRGILGWKGEGRTQDAEIHIAAGVATGIRTVGPFQVAGGEIRLGERVYDNMLPTVLESDAPVSGYLDLVNASRVEFAGVRVRIRLLGESKYVEDLPEEWAPSEGAD